MLYANNSTFPLKFVSGQFATLNGSNFGRSWAISNAALFGSSTSRPQGYNEILSGVTPPLKTGGNISFRSKKEAFMTSGIGGIGNLSALFEIETTMTVTGNVFGNIYAVFDAEADLIVSIRATGNLEADFDILARPSAFDISQEIWNATASGYNNPGTMGEKVNDAGSASNPWTEVIESGLTAAEVMRIILSVQAGKSDVSGTTVTFRDVGDTKNRVTASMTGSERTTITLDGS